MDMRDTTPVLLVILLVSDVVAFVAGYACCKLGIYKSPKFKKIVSHF